MPSGTGSQSDGFGQVDETVHLAAQAKGCGAIAASAFGAGFGGSVWALVRDADVPSFIEKWSADYAKAFPGPAGAPPPPPPSPGPGRGLCLP